MADLRSLHVPGNPVVQVGRQHDGHRVQLFPGEHLAVVGIDAGRWVVGPGLLVDNCLVELVDLSEVAAATVRL